MRRPTTLAVDTTTETKNIDYELSQSPTWSENKLSPSCPSLQTSPVSPPLQPSVRLLFSLIPTSTVLCLVLPAILFSVVSGAIAPFMTIVIGQSLASFARFPLSNATQHDKQILLHAIGRSALELVALGVGALALSSVTSCLWIWTGEKNVMALRRRVYQAVTTKDMVWFDTKVGFAAENPVQSDQGSVGAAGLMANFARETDDVRMASSLASGMLVQYLTTTLTCLILAFLKSYSLTLIILSAVPVLMIIQTVSQAIVNPLLAIERRQSGLAATLIDRAVSAISTVKAFNASEYELSAFSTIALAIQAAARKLNAVWGVTSGLAQFTMMAMFVQGFWFGAHLVRSGKVPVGDVMSVFWACLIATSNLQMCIPQFIVLAKGKFAIVSLLSLVDDDKPAGLPRKSNLLKKIRPERCLGELALSEVTFAYPSRPSVPVLEDVSLFLPSNELTFVVGASGSGKSTIAGLLMRTYDPSFGTVSLDDQDSFYLDERWIRTHVACVSQGCVLFEGSVHHNVAMGVVGSGKRSVEDVSREEVEEACRAALMHDFVRDLPDGYDTLLGNGGANLSGGQKQRLAIARAKLRDPTVLILDEATSALDPVSRVLVFEALKRWRKNKTTIVITHDLSQIGPDDFAYVLSRGTVVEQGYRYDLEDMPYGEFRALMDAQQAQGGFDVKDPASPSAAVEEERKDALEAVEEELREKERAKRRTSTIRPLSLGNWMFDVVADLTRVPSVILAPPPPAYVSGTKESRRTLSRFVPAETIGEEPGSASLGRRKSIAVPAALTLAPRVSSRPLSLQFTPTSAGFSAAGSGFFGADDDEEVIALKASASRANLNREGRKERQRWDASRDLEVVTGKPKKKIDDEAESLQPLWSLAREMFPHVPNKPLLGFGMLICLASGAMTPVFSFLLSKLMFNVSIGARDTGLIDLFGGVVLAVAALDGIFFGLKYFVMETVGTAWATRLRRLAFERVLGQDKKFFDRSTNGAASLAQTLVKDGDDARNLISAVLCQMLVVCAMLGVGLTWALVRGWQLTLVGFAIAPVFALTMAVQSSLVASCERRNKRSRETISKIYFDSLASVRAIRAMSFEAAFDAQFEDAVEGALMNGVKGAFVEGCTYGVASALIYLAEACLFYVGAVLIARGTYTYLQMIEVLNLVVFSVTIGSQVMGFTQKIAKSVQAARDFTRLLRLPTQTDESKGLMRPDLSGSISFHNVSFSYPERADVPVLKELSLTISRGECVAIVGASGSGKSTIALLLQRLYEPSSGVISIDHHPIRDTDVRHLRDHVAVVSQNPNLFDATIEENIRYGSGEVSAVDVRDAAKAANAHQFVMALPQGYDTLVGENAALISGGQAQRLAIARALARPSDILILDECTSALDYANQAAVLETIREAKVGRTTIMVTHKVPVMKMCDRILVVSEGRVVEEGSYEALMRSKGVFADLASGGEWMGE